MLARKQRVGMPALAGCSSLPFYSHIGRNLWDGATNIRGRVVFPSHNTLWKHPLRCPQKCVLTTLIGASQSIQGSRLTITTKKQLLLIALIFSILLKLSLYKIR
jgi:hypothetical protein